MAGTFKERAIVWAEKYGIIEYSLRGHFMVYNKSYKADTFEPHYTVQHTVDLRNMQELPTKRLKKFDRKGLYNVY